MIYLSEDNFNDELTEDQKRFGREHLPNDPHFKESETENEPEPLIEAVEVECLNCSVKDIQKYDTPITKIRVS